MKYLFFIILFFSFNSYADPVRITVTKKGIGSREGGGNFATSSEAQRWLDKELENGTWKEPEIDVLIEDISIEVESQAAKESAKLTAKERLRQGCKSLEDVDTSGGTTVANVKAKLQEIKTETKKCIQDLIEVLIKE
jgi:hypothetical protein